MEPPFYYKHITVIIQPSYFYISFCRFFSACGEYLIMFGVSYAHPQKHFPSEAAGE